MFGRARAMRGDSTLAERKLWAILRGRRLEGFKFRRQVPLGRYIGDFVCFDPAVVVECDGAPHEDSLYDLERDAWLRAQGFRVLRFSNAEVVDQTLEVADRSSEVMRPASRDPSPSHAASPRGRLPLPQGERGR